MDTRVERETSEFSDTHDLIVDEVSKRQHQGAFFVASLRNIKQRLEDWKHWLPRVTPFYAVKCNNLPAVVACLASLRVNFDCASKQEIDQVLALGVDPSRIIFAHPCKPSESVKHAAKFNVNLTTFDNSHELHKIAIYHPNTKLVLRIKGEDSSATYKLNAKFGVAFEECEQLLRLAQKLALDVVGVSFHNGSGCSDPTSFKKSILFARRVFDLAKSLGITMTMVDIGGGLPGSNEVENLATFEDYAQVINESLEEFFPLVDPLTNEKTNYEIIAEPGRYFVSSAFELVCMVIAKRFEPVSNSFAYYLNDGVYGSFIDALFGKHFQPELISASEGSAKFTLATNGNGIEPCDKVYINDSIAHNGNGIEKKKLFLTTLWGPTCDSTDLVSKGFYSEEFQVGDWLRFRNMGAYSVCLASNFNGFDKTPVILSI